MESLGRVISGEVVAHTLLDEGAWRRVVGDAAAQHVLTLAGAYVLFQPALQWLCAGGTYARHRAAWKALMAVYNALMSLYSLATFVLAANELRKTGVAFDACAGGPFASALFERLSFFFFLSKYVEYADTAFLIIAQKPVSMLQYFHHLGAPITMWVLWYYSNPIVWIFVAFNSFIHTWMYLYFASVALGRNLASVKVVVTSMQLVQLTVGIAAAAAYPALYRCYTQSQTHMLGWFLVTAYTAALVVLFGHFFIVSYLRPPRRRPDAAKKSS